MSNGASPPSVTFDIPPATQGPPWPPSEMMDADGNFVVVGFLIKNGQAVGSQAAIVSKDTQPPLDSSGKEDFNNPFGADYDIVRELDVSPGSPDLGIELYNSSYGPRVGSFGGGPRIPAQGQSRWNLNANAPHNPTLFPLEPLETTYIQMRYPLRQSPVWGVENDISGRGPSSGWPSIRRGPRRPRPTR